MAQVRYGVSQFVQQEVLVQRPDTFNRPFCILGVRSVPPFAFHQLLAARAEAAHVPEQDGVVWVVAGTHEQVSVDELAFTQAGDIWADGVDAADSAGGGDDGSWQPWAVLAAQHSTGLRGQVRC